MMFIPLLRKNDEEDLIEKKLKIGKRTRKKGAGNKFSVLLLWLLINYKVNLETKEKEIENYFQPQEDFKHLIISHDRINDASP